MECNEYWNDFPTQFEETDFLRQIGNTVLGNPITEQQFNATINDIKSGLELTLEDSVIDLCCGNGIRTYEISKSCKNITGVDFSKYLINIAKKYFYADNTLYYCRSVLDKKILRLSGSPFTKVLMYAALQDFDESSVCLLLENIYSLTTNNAIIFIGSIPDFDRRTDFYKFSDQRKQNINNIKGRRDYLGYWWEQNELIDLCQDFGFQARCLAQSNLTDQAYYRFDMLLTKNHER